MDDLIELVTPWFLRSGELNVNEEQELAARRRMAPTITGRPGGGPDMVGDKTPVRTGTEMSVISGAIKISAKAVERLKPYLTNVSKTASAHWTKLTEALKAKGVPGSNTVEGIIAYVRQSPMNAALVFVTMADLGINVADLFGADDKKDPEVRATAVRLDQISLGMNTEVAMRIGNIAAESEKLATGLAERAVETATLQELCSWARAFFGGARGALDAHQKLQGFIELPYAEVEWAFNNLNLRQAR